MLTHLLFSISALVFMIIFMVTYFSYKKRTNSVRSKIYVYMIYFSLVLAIVEIIEGVAYVYNVSVIFSLMWKLHSIIMILYIAALFYYLLIAIGGQADYIDDLFWDSKKIISIKNVFTIIFVVLIITSIIFIKTYEMGLTMFYFYTDQSINFLLILYLIYILYNAYIVYLRTSKDSFGTNDYVILIGTFLLFVVALVFEYLYAEISIYSTLFTLVLTLIYYFRENEDLLIIEELQKDQRSLHDSNDAKLNYLHELVSNLESPLSTFNLINSKLADCANLTDEELNDDLNSLNYISESLTSVLNKKSTDGLGRYRIDEMVRGIDEILKPNVGEKPIKFIYNIDQNLPSLLVGDSITLQRIISGLLFNAVDHTEVGKIVLNITGERQKNGILLIIKVSDSGMGIKEEDYGKIFQDIPGDYIDDDNKSSLALIKRYVESLNGKLDFESYYGAGTTFNATIFQGVASDLSLSQVPTISNDIQINDFNNKKVLILDDEDYSSRKLSNILKKYNFDIKCIKSGKEAINTLKCDEEYSLIIVSENIKDIDFKEIGVMLKQLKKHVKVPSSVGLTVNNSKYRVDNTYDEYLLKPLNLKELDDIIKRRCV